MNDYTKEITDDEEVARVLFSPSHICNGRVSPKAFKLEKLKGGAEDYISVLRCKGELLAEISSNFRPRTVGDVRYGYTFLQANEVRDLNHEFDYRRVELLPRPSKRMPYHAGIFLYLDGKLQTADDLSPDIDLFQKELAMLCKDVYAFDR